MIHSITFFLRKISPLNWSDVFFSKNSPDNLPHRDGAHFPWNINNDEFQSFIIGLKHEFDSDYLNKRLHLT